LDGIHDNMMKEGKIKERMKNERCGG